MTVQDDDQFLVNRSSTPYNLKSQNLMAELLDTDLMLVSRSGVPYKATGLEIKDSVAPVNAPPSITSVTLADDSTGGDRFDSSSFTSTLNWATKGAPEASLAMKATVTGTLDIAGTTDEITAITAGAGGVTNQVPQDVTGNWAGILGVTPTDTSGAVAVFPDGGGTANSKGTFFWSGLTIGDTITWYGTGSGSTRSVTGDIDETSVSAPGASLGSFQLTVNAASGSAKIDFNGSADCYGLTPKLTDTFLTLASDANLSNGVFQAGDSVKQNNSPFTPTSSAITNVTGGVTATWSNSLTPGANNPQYAFDGNPATSCNKSGDLVWTATAGLFASTVNVNINHSSSTPYTVTVVTDVKTYTNTTPQPYDGAYAVPFVLDGNEQITSVKVSGGGGSPNYLKGVYLNGEQLIDGQPYGETVLTLTNSNGLSDFTVGDVVQSDWNQSQTWSTYLSSPSGIKSSRPATAAFDSSLATWCASEDNATLLKLTLPSPVSFTSSVEMYSDNTWAVSVNGGSDVTAATGAWTTLVTGSGTLTTIDIKQGSTGSNPSLNALRVDGKLLVDPSIPDPSAISITAITPATPSITTDGGTWTVGNVVTGPATNITATYVSADAAAKTMTVSSLVGPWSANTGNFVENTVVNPIQIKPETSAITTVTGNVLTLTDDKDLAQFAVGANVYPDPPVAPSFAAVTYTGNGTSQSITTGLRPGLVWLKIRNQAGSHGLWDAIRGTSARLNSGSTGAEDATVGVTAFSSDGFTVGGPYNSSSNTWAAWVWSAGENSNHTYAITVANPGSGNKYYADGALQPTLTLAEGSTYKFDQSDATNATHPLKLSTTSDGTHGGGTEYTTGVTTVGTPGSAGAYTQVVIAASAPTLYTYCTAHSGMGFQINTSDTAGYTIPAGGLNSSAYDQSQRWRDNIVSSNGWNTSYPVTNLFNGVFDGGGGTANNGNGGSVTFTPPASIAVTKLELSCYSEVTLELPDGSTQTIAGVGNTNQSVTASIGSGFTFTGSNSIIISRTSGFIYLGKITINGKELVDDDVTINAPSIASTVGANPSAGFSIVSWTGTGSAATIGHGLNAAPSMLIQKFRSATSSWGVFHKSLSSGTRLQLNTTDAATTSGGSYVNVGSSTFDVHPGNNDSGVGMIAYCFAESDTQSFGSYTGNGSNTGPVINCGFEAAFVIIKCTTDSSNWFMIDNQRGGAAVLNPNANNAEQTGTNIIEFTSTGFKLVSSTWEVNHVGRNFVYMAFAEGGSPTGVVGSISNLDMTLSASTGTWQVGQKVTKNIGPAIEATANLIFNSSGAVSGLTTTEVAGQLMTDKDAPKLTFAAGPGTGETWDQELPAGTHLQTSFVATNVEGTSSATSNEITPT